MSEETASIDTSPIDALLLIRSRQEQLQQMVERAESSRSKVSEEVFRRVMSDYEGRRLGLEADAKPLRKKARHEHARLAPVHETLRRQVEEARLDREELLFRHEVGEVGDDEFGERSRAAEELLARRQRVFAEADELSQRLAAVMGSADEEQGDPGDPGARPAAPSQAIPRIATEARFEEADTAATLSRPAEEDLSPSDTLVQTSPPADADATACIEPDETADLPTGEMPTAEQPVDCTVAMRFSRLVAEGDSAQEYQLGLRTTVGRTPDNDITIANGLVSRHHAVITYSNAGYVLADLNSGNGTFVNDQRVEQHQLAEGDRLKIGPTVLVFHAPES